MNREEHIQRDYYVQKLSAQGDYTLYGSVKDIFLHFVFTKETQHGEIFHQYFIHRYEMAYVIDQLTSSPESEFLNRSSYDWANQDFDIRITENNLLEIRFTLFNAWFNLRGMETGFSAILDNDVDNLRLERMVCSNDDAVSGLLGALRLDSLISSKQINWDSMFWECLVFEFDLSINEDIDVDYDSIIGLTHIMFRKSHIVSEAAINRIVDDLVHFHAIQEEGDAEQFIDIQLRFFGKRLFDGERTKVDFLEDVKYLVGQSSEFNIEGKACVEYLKSYDGVFILLILDYLYGETTEEWFQGCLLGETQSEHSAEVRKTYQVVNIASLFNNLASDFNSQIEERL